MDDHYGWQLMRIAAQQNLGIVDAAWLQELQGVFPAMSVEDVVSRVDYGAEFKFLQLLNQAGGKLDGLVDQVNSEFADVRLRL